MYEEQILYLSILLSSMLLSACWSTGGGSKPSGDDPGGDPTGQVFSNAKFESLEFTYDGTPHILGEVTGVPEGTYMDQRVHDSNYNIVNSCINPGVYHFVMIIDLKNYKNTTLTATLTITE